MSFSHLHVHSDASDDGLRPVEQLVQFAAEQGFSNLAITDHGTVANSISFYNYCKRYGIKPIIGVEAYIKFENVGHITLLAHGDRGWKNLLKIQNEAHADRSNIKPCTTYDSIFKYNEDIIVLSGCQASPFHQLPVEESLSLAKDFKNVFGDRFLIELMAVSNNPVTWERPMELSRKLGIKHVVTGDVHFPHKEDGEIHPIFLKMKKGFSYSSEELWLKKEEDILDTVKHYGISEIEFFKDGLIRAGKLAEIIKPPNISREPYLPYVENADLTLREIVANALLNIPEEKRKVYSERAMYELDVIVGRKFSSYFLILHDIIKFAKSIGAKIGPGRGSGAGSLVLFLMGITKIDPIPHNLYFERFLNPERKGYPDVDTDIDSDSRAEIIAYALKKWNAWPVATYSDYGDKNLIHALWSFFNYPREEEKKVADLGPKSNEFENRYNSNNHLAKIWDAAYGQICHKGKHAAGVVPVKDDFLPIERATKDGEFVVAFTQGHDAEIEASGGVKYDVLGVKQLTMLKEMEGVLGMADTPNEFEIAEDGDVYDLFCNGDLVGIFQFGSDGIINFTKAVKPRTFHEIVAINALWRPGTIGSGKTMMYPELKKCPRKIEPRLDPILEETYGIFPYQEQFMKIYSTVVGGSLASGDIIRRLLAKGQKHRTEDWWIKEVKEAENVFFEKGVENGFDKELLEEIWKEMLPHADYSFNKSHSTAYALLALQSAWWKVNHPEIFYVAMLNNDPEDAGLYIADAVRHGIKIVPPHINNSSMKWEQEKGIIYCPLVSIKGLAEKAGLAITNARGNVPFVSFEDFMNRTKPTKAVRVNHREALLALGSFSGLSGSEAVLELKNAIDMDMNKYRKQQKYMGLIIPDSDVVGYSGGLITEKNKKTSAYGDYISYKFTEGFAWARDKFENFEEDDIVFVKKNDKNKIIEAIKF